LCGCLALSGAWDGDADGDSETDSDAGADSESDADTDHEHDPEANTLPLARYALIGLTAGFFSLILMAYL